MSAIPAAVQGAIADLLDEIDSYRGDMNLEPGELERMLTLDSIAFRRTDLEVLQEYAEARILPRQSPLRAAIEVASIMLSSPMVQAYWPVMRVPMSPLVAAVRVRRL